MCRRPLTCRLHCRSLGVATVLLLCSLAFAPSAWAQADLAFVSMDVALEGADTTDYLVDAAQLDAAVTLHVAVPTRRDRRRFRAALDVVALDGASCADPATLPPECVHALESIEFEPEEIATTELGLGRARKRVRTTLTAPGIDAFDLFAAEQALAGRALRLRVALDVDDVYDDDPEAGNDLGTSPEPLAARPLSGRLFFGPVETRIVSLVPRAGNCFVAFADQTGLSVDWTPASDERWPTHRVELRGADCAEPSAGSDGVLDLHLTSGGESVAAVSGERGGLAVEFPSVQLDASGATLGALRVALPPEVSFHDRSGETGLPSPRGETSLELLGASLPPSADLADLSLSTNLEDTARVGFLQPGGVPLAFEVRRLTLDESGLSSEYAAVRYAHDMPFAANDPRTADGPRSNDARLRRPLPGEGRRVRVDGSGLAAEAAFAAGSADTHYPATEMRFAGFELALAGNRLLADQVLPSGAESDYALTQSPACPGCPDGGSVPDRRFSLRPALDEGMGADGAVVAFAEALGENAAWGPDDGVTRIFERLDDADEPAVLFLPGFEATGTAGTSQAVGVAKYLLGAREARREAGALLPGPHHLLEDSASRAGNHFRAGVNVGPELLIDENGSPDAGITSSLDGTRTRIGFGGLPEPDFIDVPGDAGSKLLIRPGGVTGVFGASVVPQPSLYGYDTTFERFAFRQIANAIDESVWVDGAVHLPAPADFDVRFGSLELDCTGHVGGLSVGGQGSEQRLLAWQSRHDIKRADFVPPDDTPRCAPATRTLRVAGVTGIEALERDVTLEADWRPDGNPDNPRLEGETARRLDRPDEPATPADDLAMPLALTSGIGMPLTPDLSTGWFVLRGLIEPPFWDPFEVDLRLQNRTEEEPAQSLLFRSGTLSGIDDQALVGNDDEGLVRQMREREGTFSRAAHDWVGAIDFDHPIHYEPGRHDAGLMPRFVGRAEPLDLKLFDANARVDYITPESTKVSFGASARFDALAEEARALHVDLGDPESVARIDALFGDYLGIPGSPIASLVGALDGLPELLDCYTEGGFEFCLEERVRAAIHDALDDPDALAAELRTLVGSVLGGRYQIDIGLDAVTAQLGSPAVAQLDLLLRTAYTVLPNLIPVQRNLCAAAPNPGCDALANPLADAHGTLVDARGAVIALQHELAAAAERVVSIGAEITRLGERLGDEVAGLPERIAEMRTQVAETGMDTCDEANVLLEEVNRYRDTVDGLTEDLEGIEPYRLWLISQQLGFDPEQVVKTQVAYLQLAGEVSELVATATAAVGTLLDCESTGDEENVDFTDVLADVDAYLLSVETALGDLLSGYATFAERMLSDADGDGVADEGEYPGLLGSIGRTLHDLRGVLEAFGAPESGWLDRHVCALERSLPRGEVPSDAPCAGQLVDHVSAFPLYAGENAATIQADWDAFVGAATASRFRWYYDPWPSSSPVLPPPRTGASSFVQAMATGALADVADVRSEIGTLFSNGVWPALRFVPSPADGWDLIEHLRDLVMNRDAVEGLIKTANDTLGGSAEQIIELVNSALFEVNHLLSHLLDTLGSVRERFYDPEDTTVDRVSLVSRIDEIDGYALITGKQMERIHLTARIDFLRQIEADLLKSRVTVDVERWSSQGIGGSSCQGGEGVTEQLLDVLVHVDRSVADVATVLGKRVSLDSLFFRTTLQSGEAVGFGGGLGVSGTSEYRQFGLRDLQLVGGGSKIRRFCANEPTRSCEHNIECGAGDFCAVGDFELRTHGRCEHRRNDRGKRSRRCELDEDCALACSVNTDCPGFIDNDEDDIDEQRCENDACTPSYCNIRPRMSELYAGARGAGNVAGFGMSLGVLMGRTCSKAPLERIDPQAAEYVRIPGSLFNGVYLRGGATMPVLPGNCAFRVDAALDGGAWMLRGPPLTVGGLLSGAASGEVACLAGLRGQVTTGLEFSSEKARFFGEAFGVAGIGLDCDPETWTSLPASRRDKWCGTVDGRANVVLRNGRFDRGGLDTSGVH